VNDDLLPGGIGSDMLLPQQLREKLGLETRRDRDTLSEYYFHLLIRGAMRVHLFFSESGESDKSRFIEQLLWERQKRDGTFSSDQYMKTIQYHVKLANEGVSSIPKTDDVLVLLQGFTYSASALDTYLQCPLRFYYKYLMRIKEKEEISADLDAQDIGKFIHHVLNIFYEPCIGRTLEVRDLSAGRMKQVIDELFAQKFGAEPAGAAYLLKRQIRRQMVALLKEYQQPMVEEGEIILKGLEEQLSIHTLGAAFKGRLDRIEQRGDTFFILDYKTGSKPSKPPVNFSKLTLDDRTSWNEAVVSVQLPMYLLLYSVHTKTAVEHIVPAYLYLGKNRLGKDCEVAFMEHTQERIACFEKMKLLIGFLIKEINTAAIPFSPTVDLNKNCPTCPYTGLCGTSWVRGWKA
jgi:CRISPR/Cas system-associated exonuclease Cas4 (RecB family)